MSVVWIWRVVYISCFTLFVVLVVMKSNFTIVYPCSKWANHLNAINNMKARPLSGLQPRTSRRIKIWFSFLFFLGCSWCRFWAYKLPFPKPKMMALLWKSLHLWKINVFDPEMFLTTFWGTLGLLLGALRGILGGLWGLLIDQIRLRDSPWNSLGLRLLACCCRRWPGERRCRFLSPLGASWGRFWSPKLTIQPSIMLILLWESLHFEKSTFSIKLRTFWDSLGLLLGAFGGTLGALWGL